MNPKRSATRRLPPRGSPGFPPPQRTLAQLRASRISTRPLAAALQLNALSRLTGRGINQEGDDQQRRGDDESRKRSGKCIPFPARMSGNSEHDAEHDAEYAAESGITHRNDRAKR